jgi:hypothetical protein
MDYLLVKSVFEAGPLVVDFSGDSPTQSGSINTFRPHRKRKTDFGYILSIKRYL